MNGIALTGTSPENTGSAEQVTPSDENAVETSTTFSDVPEAAWYYEYVTALTKDGVINGMGDGTFAPDGTLTWAQAMKLLLCAHGDLSDVTGDAWADTAMSKAAQLGLCESVQDGSEEITRLDFCKAAARLFGLIYDGTGNAFTDCDDSAVLALANAGVINGYPDSSFGPAKALTRAEISKIIYLLTEPA
ncbi:MAG: S-layer homology domain-containing protein [Ruminococcaceae bacterium]|nr:S-layer homology domain-containing protein [Oscillospiraceae bacterium]